MAQRSARDNSSDEISSSHHQSSADNEIKRTLKEEDSTALSSSSTLLSDHHDNYKRINDEEGEESKKTNDKQEDGVHSVLTETESRKGGDAATADHRSTTMKASAIADDDNNDNAHDDSNRISKLSIRNNDDESSRQARKDGAFTDDDDDDEKGQYDDSTVEIQVELNDQQDQQQCDNTVEDNDSNNNMYGYEDAEPTTSIRNNINRQRGRSSGRRGSLVERVMSWASGSSDEGGDSETDFSSQQVQNNIADSNPYGYEDAAPTVASKQQEKQRMRRSGSGGKGGGRRLSSRSSRSHHRRGSLLDRVMGWEEQHNNEENSPYGCEDAAPSARSRRGSLLGSFMGWDQQQSQQQQPPSQTQQQVGEIYSNNENPYGYEDAAPSARSRRGSLLGSFLGWDQQSQQTQQQAHEGKERFEGNYSNYRDGEENDSSRQQVQAEMGATSNNRRRGSLFGSFMGYGDQPQQGGGPNNQYGYGDAYTTTSQRRGSMVDHIMAWAGAVNQEYFNHSSNSELHYNHSEGSSSSGGGFEDASGAYCERRRASMDTGLDYYNNKHGAPRVVPHLRRSVRRAYSDEGGISHEFWNEDHNQSYYGQEEAYHYGYGGHAPYYDDSFYNDAEGREGGGDGYGGPDRHMPPAQSSPGTVGGSGVERRNSLHAMVERAMAYVNMSKDEDPRDGELCAFGIRRDSLF